MDDKPPKCTHYSRGCLLVAKCCGRKFPCRRCHDEKSNHVMTRHETSEMECVHCQTVQPVAQSCVSCNKSLGRYYCDVCKFHDDSPGNSTYHCTSCGICRRGKREDYIHCEGCGGCIQSSLFSTHVCLEKSLHAHCPICREEIFTSVDPIIAMKCGHPIHTNCLKSYITHTGYTCPLCMKSVVNMTEHYERLGHFVDALVTTSSSLAYLLCNDCLCKSYATYRVNIHRCDQCLSFNTSVLEVFRDLHIPRNQHR